MAHPKGGLCLCCFKITADDPVGMQPGCPNSSNHLSVDCVNLCTDGWAGHWLHVRYIDGEKMVTCIIARQKRAWFHAKIVSLI